MSDLLGQTSIHYWLPSSEELKLFGPDFALLGTVLMILIGSIIVGKRTGICAWLAISGVFAWALWWSIQRLTAEA